MYPYFTLVLDYCAILSIKYYFCYRIKWVYCRSSQQVSIKCLVIWIWCWNDETLMAILSVSSSTLLFNRIIDNLKKFILVTNLDTICDFNCLYPGFPLLYKNRRKFSSLKKFNVSFSSNNINVLIYWKKIRVVAIGITLK